MLLYDESIADALNPKTTATPKIGIWMTENGPNVV
jgi:hypothetical protein